MQSALESVIDKCKQVFSTPDPQSSVKTILLEAANNPEVVDAVSQRTKFASLNDLAIHRSPELTLLAGTLPPGFNAAPHNHNLWSVVSVCIGQEDNRFYQRDGEGLTQCGKTSVIGPGVLCNDKDVIHSISNPLQTPLVVLHAYGGDLFATPRSNWDPETHKEIPFDWQKVSSGK